MLNLILEAVGFYLPAYVANMMPIFFDKLGLLKSWAVPIDGGRKLGKNEIFGSHKTWRGLVAGVFGGFLSVFFLTVGDALLKGWDIKIWLNLILFTSVTWGAGMGAAAILGDLLKSFFKRRLNIKNGQPFIPFDQIDFAIGAIIYGYFFSAMVTKITDFWQISLIFILITPLLHLAANVIAYKVGWKKVWW